MDCCNSQPTTHSPRVYVRKALARRPFRTSFDGPRSRRTMCLTGFKLSASRPLWVVCCIKVGHRPIFKKLCSVRHPESTIQFPTHAPAQMRLSRPIWIALAYSGKGYYFGRRDVQGMSHHRDVFLTSRAFGGVVVYSLENLGINVLPPLPN